MGLGLGIKGLFGSLSLKGSFKRNLGPRVEDVRFGFGCRIQVELCV